jgi:peptidoglycan/LPS O-acetylase OafA/YrhL
MHPTGLAETPSATTELRHNSALIAIALGVSMLSYRYFKMPFLKLKRFFHPVPANPTPAPETVAS